MIIGIDSDFSQTNLPTCPLVSVSDYSIFWACRLSSFAFNSSKANQAITVEKDVIFDTGSNMIILPTDCFVQLKNKLNKFGCQYSRSQEGYSLLCPISEYVPDFILTINGHEFTIPRLIFYRKYNNYLIPSLLFTDKVSTPIIGSPFFIAIHTLFDHNRNYLTFAPAFGTIK